MEHALKIAFKTSRHRRTVVATTACLGTAELLRMYDHGDRVFIAGNDALRLSLASVTLPKARRIFADLDSSAGVRALAAEIRSLGGCDVFLHKGEPRGASAGDATDAWQIANDTLKALRLALAFRPIMRRPGASIVMLELQDCARRSVEQVALHLPMADLPTPRILFDLSQITDGAERHLVPDAGLPALDHVAASSL